MDAWKFILNHSRKLSKMNRQKEYLVLFQQAAPSSREFANGQ